MSPWRPNSKKARWQPNMCSAGTDYGKRHPSNVRTIGAPAGRPDPPNALQSSQKQPPRDVRRRGMRGSGLAVVAVAKSECPFPNTIPQNGFTQTYASNFAAFGLSRTTCTTEVYPRVREWLLPYPEETSAATSPKMAVAILEPLPQSWEWGENRIVLWVCIFLLVVLHREDLDPLFFFMLTEAQNDVSGFGKFFPLLFLVLPFWYFFSFLELDK